MSTATRHFIDLSIMVPGEDDMEARDLEDIIINALTEAGVLTLDVEASENIGLEADGVAFCHEHDNDFAYFPVSESSLRVSNYDNNWDPYVDALRGAPPLLKFRKR